MTKMRGSLLAAPRSIQHLLLLRRPKELPVVRIRIRFLMRHRKTGHSSRSMEGQDPKRWIAAEMVSLKTYFH
ncbi:hypothetical protein AGABI2DRAFT_192733 [Agaricus bisporus var. bisporus H97]|uniref:hypothetical protein n=1 Tax=Agaricus bisporus var. bisporus (strain H97 / ATCC MYA-4626 / FGSC 10389) TaxID=936046 RepID=UPI00029F6202|nr:hypothetical protein AGABI2DRAFT_192733 [Agaricus bisporus var. bisporus H97]EKV47551.1 hypothetical protein AGABI2DRAFT_192733 [Agaricus bisporus var. bisporus H97]